MKELTDAFLRQENFLLSDFERKDLERLIEVKRFNRYIQTFRVLMLMDPLIINLRSRFALSFTRYAYFVLQLIYRPVLDNI